jgi:hypothetical protein
LLLKKRLPKKRRENSDRFNSGSVKVILEELRGRVF